MNKKLKQKGFNEYEIVIPMSDDTIKNIKANATKIVLGASIAGIMMFGGQSAKAESVHEPQAIIQTAEAQNEAEKQELYSTIDKFMSFNKDSSAENDEQKFAKRIIESANTASVNSNENQLQNSARDEAVIDDGAEAIATTGKGQSESNDETISAISGKETDEESVLNNAENKKDSDAEVATLSSVDGKEVEIQAEISKASEEINVEKTASSEDDKNLETVSDAAAEKNKEAKVQVEEAKSEAEETVDNTTKAQPEDKSEVSLDDFINKKGVEDLFNVDKIANAEDKLEVAEEKPSEGQQAGETGTEEQQSGEQPKAPKPLTDEEVAKLKAAAQRVRPGATIEVDKTTGWITVTTKVKEKQGDKEVEVERKETINPYTPAGDEALIQDYDRSNRYKETDLQPGDTNQNLVNTDENEEKDGFKFELKNPSATSPSKTEYGYEITIDKKTGQRTYTKVTVTDSGLIPAPTGEKPMMNEGEKLTPESPDITYQPNENGEVTPAGRQRNLNYEASEETLKHINNKDNESTSFGMKDNYAQDNPSKKFFGGSFSITYKVNPWPNENDSLQLMKLNGEYNEKVFVKGQDINTGVKVDNMDDNAKDRLVGQVYNPITGAIVPGARAYIADDGNIHIQMPKGALKQNEDGKYVVDKESIFNTKDYKALQHLDVKFFARPRTADEFKKIAQAPEDEWDRGTYVGTGAGTADINHKGTNVTIDKQGIDRYDHYNLIGNLKIKLDDTRYYDQRFEDGNNEDTSAITSSAVKPGEEFKVKIVQPTDPTETDKSADEMNQAEKNGEAAGKINLDFINKANEGKADKDKWKVDVNPNDISSFTVTPPKSAKAGDFVAVPVEYTYTNGSTDTKWFHFVVQESDNNRPEYHAEVGYKGDSLTQTPEIPEDEAATKKNQPKSYELVMPEDGSKYKDSAGNEWTDIKVDPKTGAVTAVVPEDADIKGGENLYVNVKVNYIDEKTGKAKEEIVKAQFIARPKYKQEVTKTFKSEIPFETKVIYDETLEIGKVVKTEGRVGETETTFKQVVINGEKGILDEKGNFVKEKEAVETKTITEKVDAEIRIGTKPAETTVTIPSDTDYETSDSLKKGDMQLKEKGEDGEVKITTSRNPETGEITTTKVTTKEAKNKKMLIGTKTESTIVHEEEIPFEYEIKFDPKLKPGEQVVDQEGKAGSKTTTYKIENSQVVGEPEVYKTDPVKAIIRVGDQKFTGETKHTVTKEEKYITIVKDDPNLDVGKTVEDQQGVRGSKTIEYTQKFENGVPGDVEEKVIKETKPQDRIIRVGTRTVTEHISKEITEEIPYKVEIKYDDTMIAGTTRVETPGQAGSKTTEYYRNLINGKFDGDLNTREVTDKYKAPINEVIVVGTKVETNKENYNDDVKVDVEYVEDNTLYKGTVNKGELTPGKVERKIVNKYDPETGKVSTEEKVVVTPAKQKIIVGTKDFTGEFSHKIEKTLPFEREIQYDDTMDAGTQKVTQKGVNGNAEQTVTQKFTNGKLANKEYTDEVTKKEPVKEIVKIGTKPVEKTVEIPFNTEYVYDNTIDAGTVVEDKDHPGKAGSVKVKTYFDKEAGKFVSVEDEISKVAPVNKIVRVGTKPTENMCPVPEKPNKPEEEKPNNPKEEEPGKPNDPGEEEPDKPNEPHTPSTPDNPSVPSKPSTLETPTEPNGGGTTVTEEKPSEKEETPEEKSETPEEKVEEKDKDSDVESKEDKVDEIEEVVEDDIKTSEGDNDLDGANENKRLPKTGDGVNRSLYAYMLGLMGSAMMAIGVKKKNKESLDEE